MVWFYHSEKLKFLPFYESIPTICILRNLSLVLVCMVGHQPLRGGLKVLVALLPSDLGVLLEVTQPQMAIRSHRTSKKIKMIRNKTDTKVKRFPSGDLPILSYIKHEDVYCRTGQRFLLQILHQQQLFQLHLAKQQQPRKGEDSRNGLCIEVPISTQRMEVQIEISVNFCVNRLDRMTQIETSKPQASVTSPIRALTDKKLLKSSPSVFKS